MNRHFRLHVAILLAVLLSGGTAFAERAGARTSVNRNSNRNVNVNSNRNTNVNVNRDVDVHVHGGYYGGGCCYHDYHPVATAAAVTATAMVIAAVIGSMVHTLPPSCTMVMVNGFTYQQCGSTWHQPQFAGTSTTYVVVNAPR